MATDKKTKKKEVISSNHLKAWLQGIEDMQDTGWVPDSKQWKKIRDKIFALKDDNDQVSDTYQQLSKPTVTNVVNTPVDEPVEFPVIIPHILDNIQIIPNATGTSLQPETLSNGYTSRFK